MAALVALDDGPEVVLATASMRARGRVERPGATTVHRRLPHRVLERLQLPGELVTGRVDVFHATNFLAPPLRRTPLVVSVHDLGYLHLPDTVDPFVATYRHRVPATVARAAAVLTLAPSVAAEVSAEYGIEPSRVHAIAPGVSERWFAPPPPRPPSLPAGAIVGVGLGNARKNGGLLLRAYERSAVEAPLVLVGSSPPGPRPPGAIDAGRLDDDDLRALVASAAVVACPSALEGFGLPILEAFAMGTPVIASDLAVHRAAAGALATFVAVPRSVWTPELAGAAVVLDEWAAALRAVIDAGRTGDDDDRRRAHARRFPWSATAAATAAVYRSVARSNEQRPPVPRPRHG